MARPLPSAHPRPISPGLQLDRGGNCASAGHAKRSQAKRQALSQPERNLFQGWYVELGSTMLTMPMRDIFPEAQIHPSITEKVSGYRKEQVAQVKALLAAHRVVVVGMGINTFPKRARRLLDSKGIAYEYLGIGSYFSQWRPRLALKMWTGWPTFPMIFLDGTLIGGFQDLKRLVESGELGKLLAAPRA